ncbi:type I-E CRISPR-associated protein Cse2/CasB [Hyphomicrobium sp. D-2]|uniref:type I-E CRISPR-associated protein Cse2/CasB n=1 Tax=Hyphomicrobium sp. D-2 TaxID=3041621 RepID=UPI002459073B|nr:type I-E CRISPR-associated protein Cse2/CasB [Hyphomicrobium sp. D-2]MDH4981170.1 type I-E CRISPR-associated protein Cse2/CasB [Hyphomicrobium sp. D-2]
MTDEIIDDETQTSSTSEAGKQPPLLERIATEFRRLNAAAATGDLAALRRMNGYAVPPAAFYRIMSRANAPEMGPETVRRWARVVAIMAQRPDALRASGLGRTLKDIGLSEQRLDMLLHARGPALYELAQRTAVRIARSHEYLPYRDLCLMVLYETDRQTDDVRIGIAQSYLRANSNSSANGPTI